MFFARVVLLLESKLGIIVAKSFNIIQANGKANIKPGSENNIVNFVDNDD